MRASWRTLVSIAVAAVVATLLPIVNGTSTRTNDIIVGALNAINSETATNAAPPWSSWRSTKCLRKSGSAPWLSNDKMPSADMHVPTICATADGEWTGKANNQLETRKSEEEGVRMERRRSGEQTDR